MILGILLGLLSSMLLISLAVSVFIYVKFSEINMKLNEFKSSISVLNMFKEQTLAEIIQLKNNSAFASVKADEALNPDLIKKINEAQDSAFEEEYLRALEARSLWVNHFSL